MDLLPALAHEMMIYETGVPERIQHFLKVHAFARLIGRREGLDERTQLILEAAAYVHDIGIAPALQKYGSCAGPLQEKEGVRPARAMLTKLGFEEAVIDRVCFLVSRHHTLEGVDGADWRILLEADYLVNSFEGGHTSEAIRGALAHVFRTASGTEMLKTMYALGD